MTAGFWGGTFYAVGNRILRGHGSALGYSSGFTIMDREDQKDLINAVAARFTNYFHKEDRDTERHLSCKLSGRESCSVKEKAAAKSKRKSKLPKKRCS
jgi:superfamily I DNA/RNA helicase